MLQLLRLMSSNSKRYKGGLTESINISLLMHVNMHSFVLEMIALDPPPVLHSTKLRRGAYRRARITKMKCQLPGIEQLPSEMLYRIFELGAEIEDDNLRGHSQFT